MWFLTSAIGRYILAGVAAVLLIGGAACYVYHKGQVDERNKAAAEILKQTEQERKDRENNDDRARTLDDDAALKCLRNPRGC